MANTKAVNNPRYIGYWPIIHLKWSIVETGRRKKVKYYLDSILIVVGNRKAC